MTRARSRCPSLKKCIDVILIGQLILELSLVAYDTQNIRQSAIVFHYAKVSRLTQRYKSGNQPVE